MRSSTPSHPAYAQYSIDRNFSRSPSHSLQNSDPPEPAETIDKPILALNYKNKGLGGAFWRPNDSTLVILADIACAHPPDLLSLVKLQTNPSVLLVPSRIDESFVTAIQPSSDDAYTISIRPGNEFTYEKARGKILKLARVLPYACRIGLEIPDETLGGHGEDILRMGGLIEWNKQNSIGCAGALIAYLNKHEAMHRDGDNDGISGPIANIEAQSLGGGMYINSDTIYALQIFQDLSHPSAFSNSTVARRTNEGLSIFSLLDHTCTPQGTALLRQWLLSPLQSIEKINERQDTIAFFLDLRVQDAFHAIRASLKKAGDAHTGLKGVRRGGAKRKVGKKKSGATEWRALLQFALNAIEVYNVTRELPPHELRILQMLVTTIKPPGLRELVTLISDVVDFEASSLEARFTVKRGVDEELDNMRDVYDGLQDLLAHTARKISDGLEDQYADALDVMYFPQLGYLVTVPVDEEGQAMFMLEGWEKAFSTSENVFFKSPETLELDEYYGDIYSLIIDREVEIIHELRVKVLTYSAELAQISQLLGELDCLLSLASAAEKYRFVRPFVGEENVINIVGGRHPLQELVVPAFVENDTCIIGGYGPDNSNNAEGASVLLLTGANYSGKSVYLKQVALIVYMAHLGSFVPAESAVIGLTDKILTRVQTRESVSKVASAFMIDVQQIALALRACTRQSLVIIDEFGKGTESHDGAGLFCAVLDHLLGSHDERPKVLIATHYHGTQFFIAYQLKKYFKEDLFEKHPTSSIITWKCIYKMKAREHLMRLRPGISLSSYGTNCAAFSGIPQEVIARAELYTQLQSRGEDLVSIIRGENSEGDMRDLKVAEEVAKRFIAWDIDITEFQDIRRELARALD